MLRRGDFSGCAEPPQNFAELLSHHFQIRDRRVRNRLVVLAGYLQQ
ncbi:MAG TPA: hypothetical protein PLA43_10865 [Bryobacteraceae bacterium]|nr:hypothetical protein [Bryobacteraceae bacterium]HOL69853.1 hypothetical protein [Bryobacteraceae bacterium]HOQ43690.1 hypothetical protein [Bryobacteraceae bacterium]HPQ14086.1 hypothetical protein [Bryobacteraceae bacterium]HPU72448.1 hypothetical protein [Bryobacteraceae bacterium]